MSSFLRAYVWGSTLMKRAVAIVVPAGTRTYITGTRTIVGGGDRTHL
jgi:hypothetical protein